MHSPTPLFEVCTWLCVLLFAVFHLWLCGDIRLQVHQTGPDRNIYGVNGQTEMLYRLKCCTDMKCCTDIRGPQEMKPTDFCDLLTPSSGDTMKLIYTFQSEICQQLLNVF